MFIQEMLMEGLLVASTSLSVQKQMIQGITWNMESSTQTLHEIVQNNMKHNRRHNKNKMIETFNTCTLFKNYLRKMLKKPYTTSFCKNPCGYEKIISYMYDNIFFF
jgi:hypothetical protein